GHALFVESDGLAIVVVARGQHNDGQVFVDERVGPVLHFASGIAFRVNVRNFLELEGAFESDRIVNAAAQIKKIGVTEEEFGEIFVEAGRVGLQNAFNLVRNLGEFLEELLGGFRAELAAKLPKMNRQQQERGELCGEGFRRSDANFRAGVRENRAG